MMGETASGDSGAGDVNQFSGCNTVPRGGITRTTGLSRPAYPPFPPMSPLMIHPERLFCLVEVTVRVVFCPLPELESRSRFCVVGLVRYGS